ncbi:hypothetical protein F5884DRAFT_759442 [Xylogone sp. PMI_703]|nr:hypothetical protein F5884DRAFT_759442 [Xylogone sp. PMI_703]
MMVEIRSVRDIGLLLLLVIGVRAQRPVNATRTLPGSVSSVESSSGLPTFTGDRDDLAEWCFTLYSDFLEVSGTVLTLTTTVTDTFTFSTTEIDTTTDVFETTIVPTPYTVPPQCYTGCVIDADQVQLYYWATPKPRANATISAAPSTITPPPVLSTVVDGKTLYVDFFLPP